VKLQTRVALSSTGNALLTLRGTSLSRNCALENERKNSFDWIAQKSAKYHPAIDEHLVE
jgi:hypothetical protein